MPRGLPTLTTASPPSAGLARFRRPGRKRLPPRLHLPGRRTLLLGAVNTYGNRHSPRNCRTLQPSARTIHGPQLAHHRPRLPRLLRQWPCPQRRLFCLPRRGLAAAAREETRQSTAPSLGMMARWKPDATATHPSATPRSPATSPPVGAPITRAKAPASCMAAVPCSRPARPTRTTATDATASTTRRSASPSSSSGASTAAATLTSLVRKTSGACSVSRTTSPSTGTRCCRPSWPNCSIP